MKLCHLALLALVSSLAFAPAADERRYLYVAQPGVRNYVEYGGVGILVYDIDRGYTFVRRIPSQDVPPGAEPKISLKVECGARQAFPETKNQVTFGQKIVERSTKAASGTHEW